MASAFIVILVVTLAAGYLLGATNQRTTTSIVTTTKYLPAQDGRPYLVEPAVYSSLGYPKIAYNDHTPFSPPEPNYTFTYHTPAIYLRVGNVTAPTIGLTTAVGLAAQAAGLNPSKFSLAEAYFVPGDIVNDSISDHPSWGLFFAESHQGYWTYGSCGTEPESVFVSVDALNGGISKSGSFYCPGGSLSVSGVFELKVTSSEALRQIRMANLSGVPTALERSGAVYLVEPRIVLFGPSSNNIAFQNPQNASYTGATRLCWIVQMNTPVPGFGYQGTFAVDGETGELVSGWAEELYPSLHYEFVSFSPDFSSAQNLNVSAEIFRIDGSVIGVSGSLPVVIPNVVIARPGSTGSLAFVFSSDIGSSVNATFSFVNPLPGLERLLPSGLPPGVTIRTSSKAIVVPGDGETRMSLIISVDQSAPAGTYLIDLKADMLNLNSGQSWEGGSYFFLSVWNGSGQWPAPPNPS